jgi:hypothetical protein
VVLDIANTGVARGKIYAAAQRGERIPADWATDPLDDLRELATSCGVTFLAADLRPSVLPGRHEGQVGASERTFEVDHRGAAHYPVWREVSARCVVPGTHVNTYAEPVYPKELAEHV